MKQVVLVILFIYCSFIAFGQQDSPKQITPEIIQKIKSEIDQSIPAFKQSLQANGLSEDAIAFSIDTFRIEKFAEKKIDIDYSTLGMNTTMSELIDSYDKLMNKYYNKLLNKLLPAHKRILVQAQKSWLQFRDSEKAFIGIMNYQPYTGGGTMYSNISISQYSTLIVKRTVEIFNYYNNIINPE